MTGEERIYITVMRKTIIYRIIWIRVCRNVLGNMKRIFIVRFRNNIEETKKTIPILCSTPGILMVCSSSKKGKFQPWKESSKTAMGKVTKITNVGGLSTEITLLKYWNSRLRAWR